MRTMVILSTLMLIFTCSCSESYVKNFKTSEVNTLPEGYMDSIEYKEGILFASGWSADKEDGAPLEKILIYVDNKLLGKVTKKGIQRPDVANYSKNPNWLLSGWELRMEISLAKGTHRAFAVSFDKMEGFTKLDEIIFVVS
jgi:hypothetical protein